MKNLENKEIFARNLRRFLDARGMQDKDLVEVTGASQTAISEWLNAKKYPRIDKIENLYVHTTICRHYMPRNMTRKNRPCSVLIQYGISTGLIIRAPVFSQPALKLFFDCFFISPHRPTG